MNPIQTGHLILDAVRTWHRRSTSRRMLAQMGERELRDIGLAPGDASFEARKRFWEV
ncbi:MAG: DUF1127 domain-containing protein [Acetobacteraceae bacterium]|nr:DUF1127 domain-containing protein [Acetobacteraceae bacterium]